MIAYTTFESAGDTATPILPRMPPGNPAFFEMLVQCSPPSVLFHKPLPGPPLESAHGLRSASQVLAYSTCGLFWSITTSTAPALSLTKRTLFQVAPPSVVLYTPRSAFGPNTW